MLKCIPDGFVDPNFKKNKTRYFVQCTLAMLNIFLALAFLNMFTQTAIIASLGATTFIIFVLPHSYSAQNKNILGGYCVSIITGIVFFHLAIFLPWDHFLVFLIVSAVAVGISIFLMAIFNLEHPPAAGLTLGLILNEWIYPDVLLILGSIIIMVIIKGLLKNYLQDLK